MFEHVFGMLFLSCLIVLLVAFLTGSFGTVAMFLLGMFGICVLGGVIVEVICDIKNGNW